MYQCTNIQDPLCSLLAAPSISTVSRNAHVWRDGSSTYLLSASSEESTLAHWANQKHLTQFDSFLKVMTFQKEFENYCVSFVQYAQKYETESDFKEILDIGKTPTTLHVTVYKHIGPTVHCILHTGRT